MTKKLDNLLMNLSIGPIYIGDLSEEEKKMLESEFGEKWQKRLNVQRGTYREAQKRLKKRRAKRTRCPKCGTRI